MTSFRKPREAAQRPCSLKPGRKLPRRKSGLRPCNRSKAAAAEVALAVPAALEVLVLAEAAAAAEVAAAEVARRRPQRHRAVANDAS